MSLLGSIIFLSTVFASSLPPAPVCNIKLVVQKISDRKDAAVKPASVYKDATVDVKSVIESDTGSSSCQKLKLQTVFQLRDRNALPPVGKCLSAKTEYSGDEFVRGQWLFDFQVLPDKDCR